MTQWMHSHNHSEQYTADEQLIALGRVLSSAPPLVRFTFTHFPTELLLKDVTTDVQTVL